MNETRMSGAKVGVLRVSGSAERPNKAQVVERLAAALTAQNLQVPADFRPWASRTPAGLSPWELRVVFIAPPLCDPRRLAMDGSAQYAGCKVTAWIGDLSISATDLRVVLDERVEDCDAVWGERYRHRAILDRAVRDGNEEACLGCGRHTPLCDGCLGHEIYETCPGCGNYDCRGCGYDEYLRPTEDEVRHVAINKEINLIFRAFHADDPGQDLCVDAPTGMTYLDVVIGRRAGSSIRPDIVVATSPSHAQAVCDVLRTWEYGVVVDGRVIKLLSPSWM